MKKKFLIFIFALAFLLALQMTVSANSQTLISQSYNFSSFNVSRTINYPAFELNISSNPSDNVTGCAYSNVPENFTDMQNLSYNGNGVYSAYITNLADGSVNDYYVECINQTYSGNNSNSQPPIVQIQVSIDLPVTASIDVPGAIDLTNPPTLQAGRTEINLYTSKPVQGTPTLTYSFDGGVTNNPLPLFGSGTSWQGYLIIPGSAGQSAVSFCFNAADLSGLPANFNSPNSCGQITSGGVFPVDTQKPSMLADVAAAGNFGNIALSWSPNTPGITQYNIYRSTSPGVDYTDYYTSTSVYSYQNNGQVASFTDSGVQPGQTYYYKIAAVDNAGNVGDLSQEVSATVLTNNLSASSNSNSLSPQLIGQVQNFLSSASSMISNINSIKSAIGLKSSEEQALFSSMGLSDQLSQAVSQVQSLEMSAQALEQQDLTQQELSTQLSALNVKLGIIESQVPTDLTILQSGSDSYAPSANDINTALLEFNSSFTQSQLSQYLTDSENEIRSSNMTVNSSYYVVQVTYLDGTISTMSVVSRQINGNFNNSGNAYLVETIPKYIASSASDVNVVQGSFSIVQQDPVLSFGANTPNILYYVDGNESISNLQSTSLALIDIPSASSKSSSITGNFLDNLNIGSDISVYGGIALGAVIIIALAVYFIFLKKRKLSDKGREILEKSEKADAFIKSGNAAEAARLYSEIKALYHELEPPEKKMFYDAVKLFPGRISGMNGGKNEN